MLNLDLHLRLDASVPAAANLTSRFSSEDLTSLGNWVWEGYQRDCDSRADWLRRNQAALDLAVQVQREKSFPWPNCSNVTFPLVTIAALQFHSRAYPALISGTSIVKYRVPAHDPRGEMTTVAKAVGEYMSYQVLEEDQAWEEQHDRLLLQIPIVGCAFVKTYRKVRDGHNVSELVPAVNLVMDYYAKSVESCGRKTQVLSFYRNEVYERCRAGTFRDFLEEPWYVSAQQPFVPEQGADEDKRKGQQPGAVDESTPLTFLEQHCWIDLDKDGYAEPYIVTIEGVNRKVARVVARWELPEDVERTNDGKVLRIRATEYYTKYGLIPSPDGSVYDLGFGVLLGPLNESVNSLVNMLTDAGTMGVAAGGFLSRGVKLRGGAFQFRPFGWQRVDSTGEDLAKGIFALPVREPSAVLFTLLTFLVNYTQRISGSTDMIAGENPGQNTPAQTAQEMVEQGMKIYSALFKRVWRCMKEEFGKLYVLNARYMPVSKPFGGGTVTREMFLGDPSQICPVADPNVTSDLMRLQQAMAIAERARMVPGYDLQACERNVLQAMKVDGVEVLYPGPDKVPPLPNPKVQIEQMKMQVKEKELQANQQQFVLTLMEQQRLNSAEIVKLMAQAEQLAAQAEGVSQGHQIALVEAAIGVLKHHDESLRGHIELALKNAEIQSKANDEPQAASGK